MIFNTSNAKPIQPNNFELNTWRITNKSPDIFLKPFFSNENIKLFSISTEKYRRAPNSIEMLNYIMSLSKLTFQIDTKTIVVNPMASIEIINQKNNSRKVLGYFEKVNISDTSIVIKYKNGDKTVYGAKYSAIVKISYAEEESCKQIFSLSPEINVFDIKITRPLVSYEKKDIFIESQALTIGSYLVSLMGKPLNTLLKNPFVNSVPFSNDMKIFNDHMAKLKMLKKLTEELIDKKNDVKGKNEKLSQIDDQMTKFRDLISKSNQKIEEDNEDEKLNKK
jgi:hypothetical protein